MDETIITDPEGKFETWTLLTTKLPIILWSGYRRLQVACTTDNFHHNLSIHTVQIITNIRPLLLEYTETVPRQQ